MSARPLGLAAFLFRRDLRINDNSGLALAFDSAEQVMPCFIFDPRQQAPANDYFSKRAFRFMLESLEDLENQLRRAGGTLYRFAGEPHEIVDRLIREHGIDAVFVNEDYTPFSRDRDERIGRVCGRLGIDFSHTPDALLAAPGEVLTASGMPFRVFTPYYRKACSLPVGDPQRLRPRRWFRDRIGFSESKALVRRLRPDVTGEPWVRGGRKAALGILRRLGRLSDYEQEHDCMADDGTTSLSAHNKFGTISIREVHQALEVALGAAAAAPIVRQLHWRDFYTQLAWFQPQVFGAPLKGRFASVKWSRAGARFDAWCEGRTGFPVVDAGMRQLNETGWMHNRARLIAGSFLVKDLHIDWREGERYFARRLVDYDPCVNNGNWQWVASTGVDTRPLRIFNPWTQQRRFDPQARYVKRWVPELDDLDAAAVHALDHKRPRGFKAYPKPIVDHAREREEALIRFHV